MTDNVKFRYEIDVSALRNGVDSHQASIRPLVRSDRCALAELMLAAYVGTTDYEGETLTEAFAEIDDWLGGTPLVGDSFGACVGGRLVSAVLLMSVGDAPLIAFVITDPEYKRVGLGRAVVEAAIMSLNGAGHEHVVLWITKGNTPSERLFESAGAIRVDRS